MAIVQKFGQKVASKPALQLTLEGENVPPQDMRRYSWLFYGNKGIGKTSLASRFQNPFFMALEPGTKGLRVRSKPVPDWDHFKGYVDLLAREGDPEMTVVVDTIDLAYDYIYDAECRRLGIDNPREENDYGATWRRIRKMFRAQVERLLMLPGGVVFLSHDTEKEMDMVTADGMAKVERVQPTIAKQGLMEIEGLVDVAGFYGYDNNKRYLWLDGNQYRVAKCRPEENFLVKGSAQRVTRVPMGNNSQEAFSNLERAFNNLQETPDGSQKNKPASSFKMKLTTR